ncbi:MAG TPA: hypothetical protein VMW19_16460 [Myxococcota bacterium]|nr:hypothetical protein [Myxococcota bacterium]
MNDARSTFARSLLFEIPGRVVAAAILTSAALSLAAAPRARAAEPSSDDPPLCREALATRPDESALDALAHAEEDLASRARKANAEAQRIVHAHIGDGERGGLAAVGASEPLLSQAAELRKAGKVICHCRQRRGDPLREDCEYLYPEKLQ